MSNIFEINSRLASILADIEENEGEVTPELEEELKLTKEDFNLKVRDYVNAIKGLENDVKLIKEEICRLGALEDRKEKTIDKLKSILVETTKSFGDESKSGSKFIDYGFGKISIRKSKTVELDDDNLKRLLKKFDSCVRYYEIQHTFESDFNMKDVLDYCNEADIEHDATEFTEEDLKNIQTKLTVNLTMDEIINNPTLRSVIHSLYSRSGYDLKPNVSKTDIKSNIEEGDNYSFARIINKENIIIR